MTNNDIKIDEFLTPQQLADELGVKLSTVYYWSHIKFIPTIKLGNLIRFKRSSIEKWIKKKESKGRLQRHF